METFIFHKPIISSYIKIESSEHKFESRRIKKQAAQVSEVSFELHENQKLASVIEDMPTGPARVWNFSYQERQNAARLTAPSPFAGLSTKKKTTPTLRYNGENLNIQEQEFITVERNGQIIGESRLQRKFPLKKYEINIAEDISEELACILLLFYSVRYSR
ncbi:hypothetical protein [Alkalicoccus daliensis]|uniref:Uncharacterized protein n=1 Tax=Alkalicoccus daliensis TaxID=745820 RepID=A0A1H0D1B6_9BACI|nr:hypothetical protein [Alkalicoccus daliensis]SDN63651.1 hypothetical protein SAMN04488053_102299 [Alkalicoccus daliensis]